MGPGLLARPVFSQAAHLSVIMRGLRCAPPRCPKPSSAVSLRRAHNSLRVSILPLEHLALSGRSKAFKIGHVADASVLGTPYSSAQGRGRSPFPIVGFAPGLPHYRPRFTPILRKRGLRFAPPLRCARFSVVRPWLLSWARSSYRTPLGAPTLRFAPPQTPKSAPNRDYAFGVRAPQKAESGLQGRPRRRSWAV